MIACLFSLEGNKEAKVIWECLKILSPDLELFWEEDQALLWTHKHKIIRLFLMREYKAVLEILDKRNLRNCRLLERTIYVYLTVKIEKRLDIALEYIESYDDEITEKQFKYIMESHPLIAHIGYQSTIRHYPLCVAEILKNDYKKSAVCLEEYLNHFDNDNLAEMDMLIQLGLYTSALVEWGEMYIVFMKKQVEYYNRLGDEAKAVAMQQEIDTLVEA